MYKRYTLDNGLRIVTEYIPFVKSMSIGIWIEAGSKNETFENNGISHFIEHMMFKGTHNKSAKEIAETIDFIGGQINAFTSKECTCFYTKVLDNHYELAIDLLSDMIFNSKFHPEDIEKEKGVICEEINMYEDSPEDLAYDLLYQSIFKTNSLGLPILGSIETVNKINREKIFEYMKEYYVPNNTVISVVGNFNDEDLLEVIKSRFSNWEKSDLPINENRKPEYNFQHITKVKDIEQIHLLLGLKGISLDQDHRYPLIVLNNILGGSMSSRLFQNIREDKGLVYSIYSHASIYKEAGILSIYAGMNPEDLDRVGSLIYEELKDLKTKDLTESELNKSKEQIKGNYILSLESTSSRMNAIGKMELLLNTVYSPEEIIKKIDQVNINDIKEVIEEIINLDNIASITVGKTKDVFKSS
ncbi:MAG: insulinase family protein [Clostridiales bacterium]|nr:insulinase family protein [Clostridiales bacterium]